MTCPYDRSVESYTPPSREVSLYNTFMIFLRVDLASIIAEAGDSPEAVRLAKIGAGLGQFLKSYMVLTEQCAQIAETSGINPHPATRSCERALDITEHYRPRVF